MRHITVTGLAMAALTTLGTAGPSAPNIHKRYSEGDACRVLEVACPAIATPTMVARDVNKDDKIKVIPQLHGGIPEWMTIARQPPAVTTTRIRIPAPTPIVVGSDPKFNKVKGGVPKFNNINLDKYQHLTMEIKTRMVPPSQTIHPKTLSGIRQNPLTMTQVSSLGGGRKHPRDLMKSTAPVEEKEEILLLPILASQLLQLPEENLPYAEIYRTEEGADAFFLTYWPNPDIPEGCRESVLQCGQNNPIKLMPVPESTEPESEEVINLAKRALWGIDPVKYEPYMEFDPFDQSPEPAMRWDEQHVPIGSVSDKTVERRAEDDLVKDLYHLGHIDGKTNEFHLVPVQTLPNEAEKNKIIVKRVAQDHTPEPMFKVITPETSEDKDGDFIKDFYRLDTVDETNNTFRLIPVKASPAAKESEEVVEDVVEEVVEDVVEEVVEEVNHMPALPEHHYYPAAPSSPAVEETEKAVEELNDTPALPEHHYPIAPSSPAVEEAEEKTDGIIIDKRDTDKPIYVLPSTFKPSPTFEEMDKVLNFDHTPLPGELAKNVIHKAGPWASDLDYPQPTRTRKSGPPPYLSTDAPSLQRRAKMPMVTIRSKQDKWENVEVAKTSSDMSIIPVGDRFKILSLGGSQLERYPLEKNFLCRFRDYAYSESKLMVTCRVNYDLNHRKPLRIKDKRGQFTCVYTRDEKGRLSLLNPQLEGVTLNCFQDDVVDAYGKSVYDRRAETDSPVKEDVTVEKPWVGVEEHGKYTCTPDANGEHLCTFEKNADDTNTSSKLARRNVAVLPAAREHCHRLQLEYPDIASAEEDCLNNLSQFSQLPVPENIDAKNTTPEVARRGLDLTTLPGLRHGCQGTHVLMPDAPGLQEHCGVSPAQLEEQQPKDAGEQPKDAGELPKDAGELPKDAGATNTTSDLTRRRAIGMLPLDKFVLIQFCEHLPLLMPNISGLEQSCLTFVDYEADVLQEKADRLMADRSEMLKHDSLSRRFNNKPADHPGWKGYNTSYTAEEVCMGMVWKTGKKHLEEDCRKLGFRYPGPLKNWFGAAEDEYPRLPTLTRRGLVFSPPDEDIEMACDELVKVNPTLPNLKSRCLSVARLGQKIGNTSDVVIKQKCKLLSEVRGDADFEKWCMKQYDDYAAKKELRKRDPWGERVEDEDFIAFCHRMNDQRPEGKEDFSDDCQWMSEQQIVTG